MPIKYKDFDKFTKSPSFETLEGKVKKWLYLDDKDYLRVLIASVIANKIGGVPIWLFVICPSGGTKTALINTLDKVEGVYPLRSLSSKTFISGDKNPNSSLLIRIKKSFPDQPVIFTFVDFTDILTIRSEDRTEILQQMRGIYDGTLSKEFGRVKFDGTAKIEWKGKVGFIAGCTSYFDIAHTSESILGERYLLYRADFKDTWAMTTKAMAISERQDQMKEDLQSAVASYFDELNIYKNPDIPDFIYDKINALGHFVANARTEPYRDYRKELDYLPPPEIPSRLAQQLITMYRALCIIENREENMSTLTKLGLSSIPGDRYKIIKYIWDGQEKGANLNMKQLEDMTGYPHATLYRKVETMKAYKVIDSYRTPQGEHMFKLSNESLELLRKIYKKIDLPEKTARANASTSIEKPESSTPQENQ